MKEKVNKVEWVNDLSDKIFMNTLFEELVVRDTTLSNITFKNCQFKNSYLGFNCKYIQCLFENCTFSGKYSSFGNPRGDITKYSTCNFIDCKFKGIGLFNGVAFEKCSFSGVFQNIILRSIIHKNSGVLFDNCDLKEIVFDNISIYGCGIFKNTILPSKGIKIYNNEKNALIEKAKNICTKSDKNHRIESEIIFDKELHSGQSYIVLDDFFINSFFKTEESREIFDNIVEGVLIDISHIPDNKTWNI